MPAPTKSYGFKEAVCVLSVMVAFLLFLILRDRSLYVAIAVL